MSTTSTLSGLGLMGSFLIGAPVELCAPSVPASEGPLKPLTSYSGGDLCPPSKYAAATSSYGSALLAEGETTNRSYTTVFGK